MRTFDYLIETVHRGAVERIRLMAMIGMVDVVGLLSVMCASGTNADVMKRLAAPQIGGVFSAMLLTLFVIPVVYMIWRWYRDIKFLAGKSAV
ncbi:MAG: efflux RND transporter permease subunit [Methylobacter sp.]|nr:efflux RND transporter permease subunit [Methylobacter sp.]